MTAAEIIAQARDLGLPLKLTKTGKLVVSKKLPPDLRAAVDAHRAEVVAALRNAPNRPAQTRDARPQFFWPSDDIDLQTVTQRAWMAIHEANVPPWLFQNAGVLTRLVRDDDGRPSLRELTRDCLRHDLAEHVAFLSMTLTGPVAIPPPPLLVANLLAAAAPPVPVCRRIVTTPVFTADGRLVTAPGYDEGAQLIYQPPPGFVLPPIPEHPTATDIATARDALLEPFAEFPFTDPEVGPANTLAALLTAIVRDLIDGVTPLFLLLKPVPGAGATLIASVITLIVSGTTPAVFPPADDDAEWRKRLTTLLLKARQLVFFDNLRTLDSPSLAAALTSPAWDDRLLGSNREVSLPIRVVWLATGNNVRLTTEQFRRTVRIELDALSECPWLRHLLGEVEYRHPNLLDWAAAERPRLVAAAIVLAKAWLAEGRPPGTVVLGSYEPWSRVVGGVLNVAGVRGFLGNLTDLSAVDDEAGNIKILLAAWWEKKGDHPALVSELFDLASHADVALPLPGDSDHARRTRFGRFLASNRNRIFDLRPGLKVKMVRPETERDDKKPAWRLLRLDGHGGLRGVTGGSGPGENSKTHIGESQKCDPEFSPGLQPPVTPRNPPCREPGEYDPQDFAVASPDSDQEVL